MKTARKKTPILLAALLLPMALMAAAFALCGVAPFGGKSLGVLDMSDQYLAFLASLRDILTGRASALYLPSLALGGDMVGVAAYYLMSPLNLLACLFSKQDLLMGVGLLYILRVGLCGLAMAYYAGSRHGWGPRAVLVGLAYGCMGFMTAYSINYLWQDCVALLPLIALGISRVTEGRGHWLYTVCLAGALAMNFYMGYILCLFSVLFFLFELVTGPGGRRGRAVAVFALSSLAAGALAAAVLVPTIFVLMGGKAGLAQLSMAANFPLPEMFAKLFPGAFNYDQFTPAGRPNIFCGSVTLALAALYFANGRVPRSRRIGTGLLLGLLGLSFWISGLDLVWHGLNVPSWYNHRYSYLFSFLLIAAADQELALVREGTRPRHLLLPVAVTGLAAALAFVGRSYDFVAWPAGAWTVAVAALVSGGLWLMLRSAGVGRRMAAVLCAGLLAVHMADLGANAKISLDALTPFAYGTADWTRYVTEKSAAFALADTGGEYARVESPERLGNDRSEPMLFGYDGLSHFGSTIPVKNLELFQRAGIPRYKEIFGLYGPDVTAGADTLLGVRYLVASDLEKPYAPVAAAGSWTVYENENALPIGWTADEALAGEVTGQDCFAWLQAVYAAAAPEVDRAVYTAADMSGPATDGFRAEADGRYVLDGGTSGTLTYTVTPRADGPLYAQLDIPDYPGALVRVNGKFLAYYASGEANGSLYLGAFAAGETVSVEVRAATDIRVDHAAFATEDGEALAAYSAALRAGGCPLEKLSGHHLTGSFTTGEGDSLLVLTIPWDEGWTVLLDGERAETVQVLDCFTALAVTPGTHTLEMRYMPAGLIPGLCVSGGALLVCVAAWLWERRKRG